KLHQGSEGAEEGQRKVPTTEADRVADRLSIDAHRDHCRVREPNLNIGVAGLNGDSFFGAFEEFLLRAPDNALQFFWSDRFSGVGALLGYRNRTSLDQLARDPNDRIGRDHAAGRLFGAQERLVTVRDYAGDIGDDPI